MMGAEQRRSDGRPPRLGRRRFLGAALGAGALAWTSRWQPALAVDPASVRASEPASGLPVARAADTPGGLLAVPRGRDIVLVRPDGADDRTVVSLQLGEFIADAALSPDRTKVAFGMFTAHTGTGNGAGGSDIVVVPVDAPDQRTVVAPRDRPGMLLAAPQWSPDGSALVFEAVGLSATGQATVSAEWVGADGTGRRTLAQAGRYPSFSPDGRTVIFTKSLPTGDALWEVPAEGGDGREIVAENVLLLIAYPRYSPDGQTIALAGVGNDPGPVPGLPPGSGSAPLGPKLLPSGADDVLAPKRMPGADAVESADPASVRGVMAHGYPASPFVVPAAGGAIPRALAPLPIDDAAVAWSPDGAWVAVSGANGLYMVNVADGSSKRVGENGSFGAIDWR
jgi:dipeptidyl aminopeptidase/acylaminoacyl peptidase